MEKKANEKKRINLNGFERRWRILEYLRKNSDSEHPVSRAMMRRVPDLKRFADGKEAFNEAVFDIAMTLNSDEKGSIRPEEQWRIFYPSLSDIYGDGALEDDDDSLDEALETEKRKRKKPHLPITDLYYRQTFSYEEIDAMIEGVLFSRMLDTRTANRLVDKIRENLTTCFYKQGPKNVCTIREARLGNREQLRKNLLLIQHAIDDEVKIMLYFNGYDRHRKLIPVRWEKYVVSPYYIVANGGRYYLLACMDGHQSMSIFRIDLMSELSIPGRNERCKGEKALEKEKVEGLPRVWDETFHFTHLNMAFDKPVPITLRIRNVWEWGDGQTRTNYTFLYDWFGDTFRYERTETEPPYGDIVRVFCSPFAMVNWALQYSDRVEVLEPESVRKDVVEKIRKLNRKYGVEPNAENK